MGAMKGTKPAMKGPGRPWPAGAELLPSHDPLREMPHSAASSEVLALIRRAILRGDIEPGAWLRQVDLASHFGVSRTPVREALRALDREGLIRLVPNHGAQVTPLSLDTFEEIYALRSGIEGLAARKAAERSDARHHAELHAQLQALEITARARPLRIYLEAEWQLRLACYEITGRQRMIRSIRNLREMAERYLRLAYRLGTDVTASYGFHERLVVAIGRNDGPAAEKVNRQALQWTVDRAWPVLQAQVEVGGPR